MEPLTRIPPPGWPKAVIQAGRIYRISRARRLWFGYFGRQGKGVYYNRNYPCYIYLTHAQAEDMIATEALPKWLRVSEGL